MRAVAVAVALFLAAGAATAQTAQFGNEDGCARILGQPSEREKEVAILVGHVNLYGAVCMITGMQAGTLMATCGGEGGARNEVLGIAGTPDGEGLQLTMPDGKPDEMLYPCD